MLEEKGATVLELPALVIKPPSTWQQLDKAIENIDNYNWLILTSANGVESFIKRLSCANKNNTHLQNLKIAVVGKKTAHFLKKYDLTADFIPPDFIADSLVVNFPETLSGQKILFPRVETGGRELLVKELTSQGAIVDEVSAYQSACPNEIDRDVWYALIKGQITVITFASSKTVKNFCTLVQDALKDYSNLDFDSLLQNIKIASIGPQTSVSCQELLQRVDIEAEQYTLEGLTKAIAQTMNN